MMHIAAVANPNDIDVEQQHALANDESSSRRRAFFRGALIGFVAAIAVVSVSHKHAANTDWDYVGLCAILYLRLARLHPVPHAPYHPLVGQSLGRGQQAREGAQLVFRVGFEGRAGQPKAVNGQPKLESFVYSVATSQNRGKHIAMKVQPEPESSPTHSGTMAREFSSIGIEEQRSRAHDALLILANQKKTWQRLGHLVELAGAYSSPATTITDVGTEHGLLAMSFALSGRYSRVLGVDLSLQNGALSLLDTMTENFAKTNDIPFQEQIPISFRVSDGLAAVEHGEADTVCIAGMGVNTMIKILSAKRDNELDLDRLRCERLMLQPTDSRPSHLIRLYDHLQLSGWQLVDERIEELSQRLRTRYSLQRKKWYISACFRRTEGKQDIRNGGIESLELPLSKLANLDENDPMYQPFQNYVIHHCQWIQSDKHARGRTNEADERWLKAFSNMI